MNRLNPRTILIITLVFFGALTALTLWYDGVIGVFASIAGSFGSAQIYVDLVIAIVLINVWIWHDAKSRGRNPWPWIVAAMLVGSFSPLVYLLTRKPSKA